MRQELTKAASITQSSRPAFFVFENLAHILIQKTPMAMTESTTIIAGGAHPIVVGLT